MKKEKRFHVPGRSRTAFQKGILAWYARNRRTLPWRRTSDPWRILVSEVMLQQTQVDRVREKYREFFARWPDGGTFSQATLAEVLRFWSGLGYNRRAKNLHAAAHVIVSTHGGRVPRMYEDLLALPGVGSYTAAAVMAFARNADVAVCDTNVRRVVLRRFIGGEFAQTLPTKTELDALLVALVPKGRSRDWHSALMDFGSAVCTGRKPSCTSCPFRTTCKAAPFFVSGVASPSHRLVRPQAQFEGSRRQARGAVIRLLADNNGGMERNELEAALLGADVEAILGDLIIEGLVEEVDGGYRLPE